MGKVGLTPRRKGQKALDKQGTNDMMGTVGRGLCHMCRPVAMALLCSSDARSVQNAGVWEVAPRGRDDVSHRGVANTPVPDEKTTRGP